MNTQSPIRVLIVDDHAMVRDGLKVFLSVYDDIKVVAEAQNGQQALELCRQTKPDVVLMDILMPGMDGPETTKRIRADSPDIQIIALTSFLEPELIQAAIQAGAISYLLKDVHADRLAMTIRDASQGRGTIDASAVQVLVGATKKITSPEFDLTARETEILSLLVGGKTNKEIANTLTISPGTVRFHVSNLLSKLGVSNRTEAVSLAMKLKLV